MERALIGIDDGRPSEVAVDWVIRRARDVPMQVRLMTAFDMILDDLEADQRRLDDMKRRIQLAAPDVAVTTEMVDHSIWGSLVEGSHDGDLLVIGSRRSRPFRVALSGDLPSRLAGLSVCPIVIVPEDWRHRSGDIVVGVADDPHESEQALTFAAREASTRGRRLDIVHAWQHPSHPSGGLSPISVLTEAAARGEHRMILSAASDRLRGMFPDLVPHESLVLAAPGRSLLDHLGDAELVVLGTHHRRLGDLVLGTIVQQLMHHSATPVCVVPQTVIPVSA